MLLCILFVCISLISYKIYIILTSFSNKYIFVKNIEIKIKGTYYDIILYDSDCCRYMMSCNISNADKFNTMRNVHKGNYIVISGYGYNLNILNLNCIISDIEFY